MDAYYAQDLTRAIRERNKIEEEKVKLDRKVFEFNKQLNIDSVKANLKGQLDNINIQEKDGSITNLAKKYGNKKKQ